MAKLYAIVADETMPDKERIVLYETLNKTVVEWQCLLGDRTESGEFMLYPSKDAIGGIRVVPPNGWTAILQNLNRLTPLKVKGRLVSDFNGLHLDASSIALDESRNPVP